MRDTAEVPSADPSLQPHLADTAFVLATLMQICGPAADALEAYQEAERFFVDLAEDECRGPAEYELPWLSAWELRACCCSRWGGTFKARERSRGRSRSVGDLSGHGKPARNRIGS